MQHVALVLWRCALVDSLLTHTGPPPWGYMGPMYALPEQPTGSSPPTCRCLPGLGVLAQRDVLCTGGVIRRPLLDPSTSQRVFVLILPSVPEQVHICS